MNPVGEPQTPASLTGFVLHPMNPLPMKSRFLIIALFACLSILGCKKDGIAATERLIVNTWKLSKYSVNGTDKTGSLLISDFTEENKENSFYGYSYWCINSNQDTIAEKGSTYQLYADADSVSFYATFEIPLTIDDTIVGSRWCRILRLTESKFVYEFQLNGRLHEFQMVGI